MSDYEPTEQFSDSQTSPSAKKVEEIFNTILSAAEYAEMLRRSSPPFETVNEVTVPELLLSSALAVPECFKLVGERLQALTFTFKRSYVTADKESDPRYLSGIDLKIDAVFGTSNDDPDWHIGLQSSTSELNDLSSYTGLIHSLKLPDKDPYKATAPDKEIATLINSLLDYAPSPLGEREKITHPTISSEANAIESVLIQSLNAQQQTTLKYKVELDGLPHTIETIWENDVAIGTTITRHNGGRILILNGAPLYEKDDEVYDISMAPSYVGVGHYHDTSQGSRENQDEKLKSLRELIRSLAKAIPTINKIRKNLEIDDETNDQGSDTEEGPPPSRMMRIKDKEDVEGLATDMPHENDDDNNL